MPWARKLYSSWNEAGEPVPIYWRPRADCACNKLVDAAAMKVGVDLGLVAKVIIDQREKALKRKKEEKERAEGGGGKKKKRTGEELHFLRDNLGITGPGIDATGVSKEEKEKRRLDYLGGNDSSDDEEEEDMPKESYYVSDETDELRNLPEDDRRTAFQAQYKAEVERQKKLLGIKSLDDLHQSFRSQVDGDDDLESIAWEDG